MLAQPHAAWSCWRCIFPRSWSPIRPTLGWDQVKGFTQAVAEFLERTFPDRFTAKLLKVSRRGKIFIIRYRFMGGRLLNTIVQVVIGRALVFAIGVWLGRMGAG